MGVLAIKGHASRGNEVIELLEMLGGINEYNLRGNTDEWFVLNGTQIQRSDRLFAERGSTLEGFLEKFPYKVGDKVQHKGATSCGSVYEVEKMRWVDNEIEYTIKRLWYWNDHQTTTAEHLKPYKEETMEEKDEKSANHVFDTEIISFDIAQRDKYELDLQGKFRVVLRKGKYYVERIKPRYPKTYEECCKALFPNSIELGKVLTSGYNCEKLKKFGELLICRDAYWKITGDWKPNLGENFIYAIGTYYGTVEKRLVTGGSGILLFPTEEMRDAFYENFKELIEKCKYLL